MSSEEQHITEQFGFDGSGRFHKLDKHLEKRGDHWAGSGSDVKIVAQLSRDESGDFQQRPAHCIVDTGDDSTALKPVDHSLRVVETGTAEKVVGYCCQRPQRGRLGHSAELSEHCRRSLVAGTECQE
ncbi:MAG: hypothetical protein ACTH2U_00085 [Brevibacterium sp.]